MLHLITCHERIMRSSCCIISTTYLFIKPFLDTKMSIFERYGAFNKSYEFVLLLPHSYY